MAGYRPYSYQYETSPRKLQPDYEVRGNNTVKKKKSTLNTKKNKVANNQVKKNNSKTKKTTTYNYKPVVYIVLGFVMLCTISYRYSLINEKYNQKENIKSQVSAVQKENEQLKVSI